MAKITGKVKEFCQFGKVGTLTHLFVNFIVVAVAVCKRFIHCFFLFFRYYMFMFTHYLSSELRQTVNQLNNCEDILMNFLVSDISKYPPIKITQRKAYKDSMVNPSSSINKQGGAKWQSSYHFAQRQVSATLESL